MWGLNCIQNLDWQGLQMSRENNIHFKKDDMKMTSASSNDTPGIKLSLPAGTAVKLDKLQRKKKKKKLFGYQRVSKRKGLEVLRSAEKARTEETQYLIWLSPKVFTDS